ncbi:creatininase family protein [Prochlorococcus sp. MIT 0603]|uniref:creatininase family protein n=1 Tax=unclassified Prochlorococcus TaxID=2627481 RepID=UPI0005337E67|nr:Creatinine amidohydrolase related enzyme [Prochlorococcus sp. MIT 0603]
MRNFAYLSWPDASEAALREGSTLVWPFGACEQHGPHLPLITDAFFAKSILFDVLNRLPNDLPIWSLPSQTIGFSPEHLAFPGTLSLSGDLMMKMVSEIGRQLAGMGFKRLVFFNAHGGQIGLLQAIARELRVQCPSMAVLPCFLWSGIDSLKNLIPDREVEQGLHAALAETSLMLSLNSHLVGDDRPFDGGFKKTDEKTTQVPKGWSLEGSAPCAWLTHELSKTGVIGDSRGASSDLGDKLKDLLVDHWVELFLNLMNSNWPPLD